MHKAFIRCKDRAYTSNSVHDSWISRYVLCCPWHCSRVFAMLTESDSFNRYVEVVHSS